MSDYEKLKELLESFEIIFRDKTKNNGHNFLLTLEYGKEEADKIPYWIEICSDEAGNKVSGYSGIYTAYIFDKDGKFEELIISE